MQTLLLVFEFLGTTELLVIAVVALILFGPRKLPEIGRTVGKGLAEFKRASDDFKRTWEYEVELENRKAAAVADTDAARGELAGVESPGAAAPGPEAPAAEPAGAGDGESDAVEDAEARVEARTIARGRAGDEPS